MVHFLWEFQLWLYGHIVVLRIDIMSSLKPRSIQGNAKLSCNTKPQVLGSRWPCMRRRPPLQMGSSAPSAAAPIW